MTANHRPKPIRTPIAPLLTLLICHSVSGQTFTNVSLQSGLNFQHSYPIILEEDAADIAGGGSVADYDQDGDLDIFLVGGIGKANSLFENLGNGQFSPVTSAGNLLSNYLGSGPLFTDVDGDKDLDLLIFSIQQLAEPFDNDPDLLGNRPRLLTNDGQGVFTDTPTTSGFNSGMPSYGAAMADFDKDGDLDMFMSHWDSLEAGFQLFWENDGTGSFSEVTAAYLGSQIVNLDPFSFTPNITDINQDGWLDILLAADFGTSRIFLSKGIILGQLEFDIVTPAVINDENGMGAAVGDYDNDGDMDWFVTSIWDPNGIAEGNWGTTGNRLYRNTGNGTFEDVTDAAGVRQGYWGWGACFADFNNDGYLDIYHENGFSVDTAIEFHNDPSRLFMSNGDGTFTESSAASGLDYTGQGRGVSCFDYDLDGDLDILIMPNNDAVRLYRNDLASPSRYLSVILRDNGPNPFAIGARIRLITSAGQQMREVTAGSNFVSNNPMRQHFGLGETALPNQLLITWPDGSNQTLTGPFGVNQILSISRNCRTSYLRRDAVDNSSLQLTMNASKPDGTPQTTLMVTLTITSGPHSGQSQAAMTNANGDASFLLNRTSVGLDRIKYEFSGPNSGECLALIDWQATPTVFINGFESQ